LEAGGKCIVILNRQDAEFLGVHALERVRIEYRKKSIVAIVDISERFAKQGEILLCEKAAKDLKLKGGEEVSIKIEPQPESVNYIKQKIAGLRLSAKKIEKIVRDVVERKLSDVEIAAFLTALHIRGISMDEAENLSRAMIKTGKNLNLGKRLIVDKHSIGGIPGDKTSLLLVPIVASIGLTIPKTSSRAITSPAGTADRMECLANVEFAIEEIEKIVRRTNGCIVWGGALELAPADDLFIQVEFPLGIDPMLFPSIMSKKKAVGAKYVVMDIPTGRGAKVKTIGEAHELAESFIELGKRLNMQVVCGITFGEQPLGHAIGPALEAKEALLTFQGKGAEDVIKKVTSLAGILFELVGKGNSKLALKILQSGKAEKKLREIIAEQGGNSRVKPEEIPLGEEKATVVAKKAGKVLWINNHEIALLAKMAGAPKYKGAGIWLHKKIGDNVKEGEKLFTIYSEKLSKLERTLKFLEEIEPIGIGKKLNEKILLGKVPAERKHERAFILER
jgi:AMP phosphorylase